MQAFDAITIGSVILTALLLIGAIFLAQRRRRMVMAVGLGAVASLMTLGIVIRTARDVVVSNVADPQGSAAVGAIFNAAITDLRSALIWVAVVGIIVVVVAYLIGRPSWLELAFLIDLALAILLAALAGLVELTMRNLREPIEA